MKNRANTEQKLIKAVDHIVNARGFKGLGVNKVAKQAGVSKILIYRYFGTFERLLKCCVYEKDFWTNHMANSAVVHCNSSSLKDLFNGLLDDEQFSSFFQHCEMEALILNSLAGQSELVSKLSNNTGYYSDEVYLPTGNKDDSITYFKVVSKLLIAGTMQLVLQSQENEHTEHHQSRKQQQIQLQQSITKILSMSELL